MYRGLPVNSNVTLTQNYIIASKIKATENQMIHPDIK